MPAAAPVQTRVVPRNTHIDAIGAAGERHRDGLDGAIAEVEIALGHTTAHRDIHAPALSFMLWPCVQRGRLVAKSRTLVAKSAQRGREERNLGREERKLVAKSVRPTIRDENPTFSVRSMYLN